MSEDYSGSPDPDWTERQRQKRVSWAVVMMTGGFTLLFGVSAHELLSVLVGMVLFAVGFWKASTS